MPLQATSGAASYDAFGGGVPVVPAYIEEVFSTYVYKGTGSQNQNITNGIDLSTKGGLVWIKSRIVTGLDDHWLQDTARGIRNGLKSNSDAAQATNADIVTAVLTNGYTDSVGWSTSDSVASWTFRKQPKFFDVVTYTGDGTNDRNVPHNLGSAPACYIVKATSTTSDWYVYHRGLASPSWFIRLNTTAAQTSASSPFDSAPTSTTFNVWHNSGTNSANASGVTYVAYLFAHNAGGFGLTGTDNVISCGSFSDDSSGNATVNLGFEPQWILQKQSNSAGNWFIADVMRGMSVGVPANLLRPNLSSAESAGGTVTPTATGFTVSGYPGSGSYIYIAIRRGPMKVPTSGTTVFTPIAATPSAGATANIAVTPDMFLYKGRTINDPFWTEDRLRRFTLTNLSNSSVKQLQVNSSAAEVSQFPLAYYIQNANMLWGSYLDGSSSIIYNFRRAPSFFDEVCYTGTGSATTVTHNLGVAPELIITKARSSTSAWAVYASSLGNNKALFVNTIDPVTTTTTYWNNTAPTSSVFSLGTSAIPNSSGETYVAYLFATCAGVSKVGSYTGTGSTQTISCGFTGGARFVMIKRTNADGDWWVWDTARGMVSGNDNRLGLNLQTADQNANWVFTTTGGFQIVTSDDGVNASGSNYIFLAIA
jgi:hypothetical protein